jgi:hypothetical protein
MVLIAALFGFALLGRVSSEMSFSEFIAAYGKTYPTAAAGTRTALTGGR